MANSLVGFKEYNGKKSELLNVNIEQGDIVFGIDSENNLPYIYHNGVFYSDASEISEALPEIHVGSYMPVEKDAYVKVWIDTDDNPISLKYKDTTTNKWVSINEIHIGDTEPEDENIKVWYQTNVNLPEEYIYWADIKNKPNFSTVAFTGDFNDLKAIPDFTLTYIGEGEPEINSDFNRWINPNEDSFDGVDVYNALIEYVNTKFKAIDELLELIIGEEI